MPWVLAATRNSILPDLPSRIIGNRLDGDPDRLLLQEDIDLLREFGPIRPQDTQSTPIGSLIDQFIDWCLAEAECLNATRLDRLGVIVTNIAELWPAAWGIAFLLSQLGLA